MDKQCHSTKSERFDLKPKLVGYEEVEVHLL